MMQTKEISYQAQGVNLTGYLAFDANSSKSKKPVILVAHDWTGRNEFACNKAKKLAELGYVGFALDMFGSGILGANNEEKAALIKPLLQDRQLLQARLLAAVAVVKNLEIVDAKKIGAIGFCFGGLCVLDLARSGEDIIGVVSFHGLLGAPENAPSKPIIAKVLVMHGHDDPMVPPDQVLAFEQEMTSANVDWQVHVYGNTKHAFTNPLANDPSFGTVYNKVAEERSWVAMQNFFTEIFST